ncbi:helix-turn-helix domain-containing protein [Nitrosomonas mobilis]
MRNLTGATLFALIFWIPKKVNLEALDKLCELFNCPLSDLLEHIPD